MLLLMRSTIIVALFLTSACSNKPLPDYDDMWEVETVDYSAAWTAAGLPDPSGCPQVMAAFVEPVELASYCDGQQSLYSDTYDQGEAALYGCLEASESSMPVAILTSIETPERETIHQILAHEVAHAWSACLFGGPDRGHLNAKVWDVVHATAR